MPFMPWRSGYGPIPMGGLSRHDRRHAAGGFRIGEREFVEPDHYHGVRGPSAAYESVRGPSAAYVTVEG